MGDWIPEDKRGPAVAPGEDLYRVITIRHHWKLLESRPSSALFHNPIFSAYIKSSVDSPSDCIHWLSHISNFDCFGVVELSCQNMLDEDYSPHHEPECNIDAHANVYAKNPNPNSKSRKKAAKRLAKKAVVIISPTF